MLNLVASISKVHAFLSKVTSLPTASLKGLSGSVDATKAGSLKLDMGWFFAVVTLLKSEEMVTFGGNISSG